MMLEIEIEVEKDGRWLAEVINMPGCLAYGATERAAVLAALGLYYARIEFGK